jgi:polyhydroxyalkanoate synthesis regulator phasin
VESLSGLAEQAVSRAGLARAKEVSELKRRVNELERRIERVTKAA